MTSTLERIVRAAAIAAVLLTATASAQQPGVPRTIDISKLGPQVGTRVPEFELRDHTGRTVTLESIMGAKGVMLVFFRSADW